MVFIRSLSLVTLGWVLCVSMFAGHEARQRSEVQLPLAAQSTNISPSPTPQPTSETKRPDAVRRFFSWTRDQLARPFRRQPRFACSLPPVVTSITTSKSLITFCPTTTAISNLTCSPDREVKVVANAASPEGTEFLYTWSVTGGTLQGQGREVTWDLSGLAEGTYTATVELNDGHQHTASGSTTVTIALCPGCEKTPPLCPTVSISCSNSMDNQTITFEATVADGGAEMKPIYNWSVTAGKIISGQGTSKLIVDISELSSRSITASVSLAGADPACMIPQASCTNSH